LPDEPDNLTIEVWNLNSSLTDAYDSRSYDLIHSRFVAGGILKDRWPSYVKDLRRLLVKGGWVQMIEYNFIIQSDAGLLMEDHAIQQWQTVYKWYMDQNRDCRSGRSLAQWMRTAGLHDVEEYIYSVPIGAWKTGECVLSKFLTLNTQLIRSVKRLLYFSALKLYYQPSSTRSLQPLALMRTIFSMDR
jgi:hypothetical protein